MSSSAQPTTSSNVQSIINAALADYTKTTGIDLSKSPFAATLEQSKSPEDILELLQEGQKAFIASRNRRQRLISCLRPVVTIIHSFSGILGKVVSLPVVSVTFCLMNLLQ